MSHALRLLSVALGAALAATGCGALYPRYTTALMPAPAALAEGGEITPPPDFIQRIAAITAEVPNYTRDNRPWDSDGGPDPYVVVYRNGSQVFRTPTAHNTFRPTWDPARVFADLVIRDTDRLRIQLLDDDGITSDPIGFYEVTGVPTEARNSGQWLIPMEAGVVLQMQASPPPPQLGLGVTYEYHSDSLAVLAVEEAGPAYTAGMRAGDHITAIGGRAIGAMTEGEARQGMDQGAMSDVTIALQHGGAPPATVTIRRDAVYPAR